MEEQPKRDCEIYEKQEAIILESRISSLKDLVRKMSISFTFYLTLCMFSFLLLSGIVKSETVKIPLFALEMDRVHAIDLINILASLTLLRTGLLFITVFHAEEEIAKLTNLNFSRTLLRSSLLVPIFLVIDGHRKRFRTTLSKRIILFLSYLFIFFLIMAPLILITFSNPELFTDPFSWPQDRQIWSSSLSLYVISLCILLYFNHIAEGLILADKDTE